MTTMVLRFLFLIFFVNIVLAKNSESTKKRKFVKITIFNIKTLKTSNETIEFVKLDGSLNGGNNYRNSEKIYLRKQYLLGNVSHYYDVCKIINVTVSEYFSIFIQGSEKVYNNIMEPIKPYHLNIDERHILSDIYFLINLDIRIIISDMILFRSVDLFSARLTLSTRKKSLKKPEITFDFSKRFDQSREYPSYLTDLVGRKKDLNKYMALDLLESVASITNILPINNININYIFGNEHLLLLNLKNSKSKSQIIKEIVTYRGFQNDSIYWSISYRTFTPGSIMKSHCLIEREIIKCNKEGVVSCKNPATYNLPKCDKKKSLCRDNPCLNNGECIEKISIKNFTIKYLCKCSGGYFGKYCEIRIKKPERNNFNNDINGLKTNPVQKRLYYRISCKNGGDIILKNNTISCKCSSELFAGAQCEFKCDILCPVGFCLKERNKFICTCKTSYCYISQKLFEHHYVFGIILVLIFISLFSIIKKIMKPLKKKKNNLILQKNLNRVMWPISERNSNKTNDFYENGIYSFNNNSEDCTQNFDPDQFETRITAFNEHHSQCSIFKEYENNYEAINLSQNDDEERKLDECLYNKRSIYSCNSNYLTTNSPKKEVYKPYKCDDNFDHYLRNDDCTEENLKYSSVQIEKQYVFKPQNYSTADGAENDYDNCEFNFSLQTNIFN